MKGLCTDILRTNNAWITIRNQPDEAQGNGIFQERPNCDHHADHMVAILFNHKRAAPKTHRYSMAKVNECVQTQTPGPWFYWTVPCFSNSRWFKALYVQVRPHGFASRSPCHGRICSLQVSTINTGIALPSGMSFL